MPCDGMSAAELAEAPSPLALVPKAWYSEDRSPRDQTPSSLCRRPSFETALADAELLSYARAGAGEETVVPVPPQAQPGWAAHSSNRGPANDPLAPSRPPPIMIWKESEVLSRRALRRGYLMYLDKHPPECSARGIVYLLRLLARQVLFRGSFARGAEGRWDQRLDMATHGYGPFRFLRPNQP